MNIRRALVLLLVTTACSSGGGGAGTGGVGGVGGQATGGSSGGHAGSAASGKGGGAGGAAGGAGAGGAAGATGGAGNGGTGGGDDALCGASPGVLAWGKTAIEAVSTTTPVDIVMGQTDDVVAAAVVGGDTFAQYRWDASGGTKYTGHEGPGGEFTGPLFTSGLWINPVNDAVFFGYLQSKPPGSSNTDALLVWLSQGRDSTPLFSQATGATLPTSTGAPVVGTLQVSGDSFGNVYGAFSMAGPQYFPAGDYGFSPTGTALGIGDTALAQALGAQDFLWTGPDGDLVLLKALTANTDLGCGPVVVPAAGGVALAKLTWAGACEFSKLLALPTAAVKATSSRLGADGSILMAVLYSGTINFGGGPLTSAGPNALAVASFDGFGSLHWAKSFGSGNSSFTLGSLAANASGTAIVTGGYAGGVDLGGGQLSASDDTFLVSFDSNGQYRWGTTVTVGPSHRLVGTVGKCGVALATDSTTVDLGQGPSYPSPGHSWLVVGALGL